ncbi:hypothetical protein EVAR_32751_1 [Eumeta japonica]|uniref:Uncharacterized protein n=1 Tax=Eumeta variegata TaxID=151549 RepID=A0A4C1XNG1_EUMVA|nr:hypothetical protein EVAR_32751_1 [Eumeta japonica]
MDVKCNDLTDKRDRLQVLVREMDDCRNHYEQSLQQIQALQKEFGFTRGHSTIDAGIEFVQNIFGAWEDLRDTIGVLCDLFKTLDYIYHETLIGKQRHYKVTGRAFDLLKLYWSNNWVQKVDVNGIRSSGSIVHMGVSRDQFLSLARFLYSPFTRPPVTYEKGRSKFDGGDRIEIPSFTLTLEPRNLKKKGINIEDLSRDEALRQLNR